MSYFKWAPQNLNHHQKWLDLVNYIRNEWRPEQKKELELLKHPLEAKALAIFSIARRLLRSAMDLGHRKEKLKFVEAATLLFPMIELVGHARIGKVSKDQFYSNLAAGIEWLQDPKITPKARDKAYLKREKSRIPSLGNYYVEHDKRGPRVQDLFFIRNYFLHGLKSHGDKSASMPDMMNYELPMAIMNRADDVALKEYWQQLRQDDGNHGWLRRLADADIEPFIIQGSKFKFGLINPDIVNYLEGSVNL